MPPKKKPRSDDALSAYRAKRALERTPEPAGAVAAATGPAAGGAFVVHKHAARQLHYDLRLEMEGALRSWAVPKGPSRDPKEKRLAVHVEDHPIEYGDFEGVIPEGNYGAGATIIWDRGQWIPIEDPIAGLAKGKLLFELRGYKLRGRWTLVKIKKSQKDWLLIKERDGYAGADADDFPDDSVLSGLTVEELGDGRSPADEIRAALQKLRAPKRLLRAADIEPMLAETRDEPFSRAGWLFELKYDGYRILAGLEHGEARLLSRNGNDLTPSFPEVALALSALPYERVVLDGEVVVHDDDGHPSFQRLQQRARLRRPPDIRRATVELPATYYAFDLLAFGEHDLRPLPLRGRKTLLQRLLPTVGAIRFSDHIEDNGTAFYREVEKLGLEGILAKKASSPYRAGRSADWIKLRVDRTDDFVVVGFKETTSARGGFGSVHVASYVDGTLVYAGSVGSGFTEKEYAGIQKQIKRRKGPACEGAPANQANQGSIWVEPKLVVEVRYKEITEEGLLRQPVFVRFRDDKKPTECITQRRRDAEVSASPALRVSVSPRETLVAEPERKVVFSNLDKLFWPENGYTKRDLIEYYRAVSPWLLPYLKDRPVVLTRYPDGIHGKSFFQKDAPDFAPAWLRTQRLWGEDAQRELNYFIAEDEPALLYLANSASIPLHIWASRLPALEKPDWCILDLDPKEAPFEHVVTVARALHELCEEVGLPAFVKTSGSSGLHVLLPLGRQCTHEQARLLGELIARAIVAELPDIATITRVVGKRGARVYVDYLQNGHGKLLVAPFSVRPLPGAPVSTPLAWREVNSKLDIRKFTIETVPKRLKKLKDDPLRPVLELRPDLVGALERLHARLAAADRARRPRARQ